MKKTEGGQTILYINQYYEKNLTTGVVTTSYYLGGQLVANRVGTTLTYIHQDSLSSTSVMSTSTGTLDSVMTFYPFGATRTGSVSTDKKFTGQRLDGTGLYYYGARYYDATIGRFISPDSVGQKLTDPQSLNRYTYCQNNPLKYTDPTGHDQIITTGGVNDNGDTWYTICDGQGNLLAIATGIDDLAQKMNDCDAVSRNVDLPLGKGASDFINAITGQVKTPEPTWPTFDNGVVLAGIGITGVVVGDDVSGIGVIDDIAIPIIWGVAVLGWEYQNRDAITQASEYISYHVDNWWDSTFFAHTNKARPSTKDQHEKGEATDQRNKRGGEKGDSRRPYIPPAHK